MKKRIEILSAAFVILVFILLALASIGEDSEQGYTDPDTVRIMRDNTPQNETQPPAAEPTATPEAEPANNTLTFGDTFLFDNLEITFNSDISFVVLENMFSDLDGSNVIRIPITITNRAETSHGLNMFYVSYFGPDGLALGSAWAFFSEDDVRGVNMRPNATLNSYLHVLYNGDGDYYLEFSMFFGGKIEVRLPIQR
jgi:hypothetical protein